MNSPSPVLDRALAQLGELRKIRSTSLAGMPIPSSATAISIVSSAALDRHGHGPAARRVLDRVRDELIEHLPQLLAIRVCVAERCRRPRATNRWPFAAPAAVPTTVCTTSTTSVGASVHLQVAAVEPGDIEQGVDDRGQPLRLGAMKPRNVRRSSSRSRRPRGGASRRSRRSRSAASAARARPSRRSRTSSARRAGSAEMSRKAKMRPATAPAGSRITVSESDSHTPRRRA